MLDYDDSAFKFFFVSILAFYLIPATIYTLNVISSHVFAKVNRLFFFRVNVESDITTLTNKHTHTHTLTDGSQRKERSYKEGKEIVHTMFYCKCLVHFGAVVFTRVYGFDDER